LVGDVVVAAMAWTFADWNAVVKLVAAIERLAQAQDVGFSTQPDAELLAHPAAAAVAADHVLRANGPRGGLRRHPGRILLERLVRAAILHHTYLFRHRLQQRLERVLRDELVGLERQGAVV